MFKIARLLILLMIFIPVYSCSSYNDEIFSGDENGDRADLYYCKNCIDLGVEKYNLKRGINNLEAQKVGMQNAINSLDVKNKELDRENKELKDEQESNEFKNGISALCIGGLCAGYAYKNFRLFQGQPFFIRIPIELSVSTVIGLIPFLYQVFIKTKCHTMYRYIRGGTMLLTMMYCTKPLKNQDQTVALLLGLRFIIGPVIIDRIGARVEHNLKKKKVELSFDLVGVLGTIAMIHVAYLPWIKMAALLTKK